MAGFTAKLELPEFIPKEKILGKHVFDSEVVYVGVAEDWTYCFDGQVKVVVKVERDAEKNSTVLILFSHIDRVGHFILLKTGINELLESVEEQQDGIDEEPGKREGKEKAKSRRKLVYPDELDEKKLKAILNIKNKREKPEETG